MQRGGAGGVSVDCVRTRRRSLTNSITFCFGKSPLLPFFPLAGLPATSFFFAFLPVKSYSSPIGEVPVRVVQHMHPVLEYIKKILIF